MADTGRLGDGEGPASGAEGPGLVRFGVIPGASSTSVRARMAPRPRRSRRPRASISSSGRAEPPGDMVRRNRRTPSGSSRVASMTNGRRSISTVRSGRWRVYGQRPVARKSARGRGRRPDARRGWAGRNGRHWPAPERFETGGFGVEPDQARGETADRRRSTSDGSIGPASSISTTSRRPSIPGASARVKAILGQRLKPWVFARGRSARRAIRSRHASGRDG